MANDTSTILDQFHDYKQFYLNQISNKNVDKDVKMYFMDKVINDLMEQNELLLQMLLEVNQSAKDRSVQMHALLEQTASKSCEVGLALSSYELEVKTFSQQSIPSFIECVDWVKQIKTHVECLENENSTLRKENESFFQNIQSQNVELIQYKSMVYSLMSGQGPRVNVHLLQSNEDYLEIVLHNKLIELNDNVDSVICANVLEEMISTVESSIEIENNQDCCFPQNFVYTKSKPVSAINKQNDKLCDINDNYVLDSELDESDRSFIECLEQQSYFPDYDLNCFRPQILSLLSNVCNELALKTPVIHELKRQLSHIKNEHLSLHNRYFQMGLQVLSTFVGLKEELESNQVCSQTKQRLIDKIDLEMSQVLCSDPSVFPIQLCNQQSSANNFKNVTFPIGIYQ